jgi:hypothetical protein
MSTVQILGSGFHIHFHHTLEAEEISYMLQTTESTETLNA